METVDLLILYFFAGGGGVVPRSSSKSSSPPFSRSIASTSAPRRSSNGSRAFSRFFFGAFSFAGDDAADVLRDGTGGGAIGDEARGDGTSRVTDLADLILIFGKALVALEDD